MAQKNNKRTRKERPPTTRAPRGRVTRTMRAAPNRNATVEPIPGNATPRSASQQKSAGVNRSEGIRLFKIAGRPTKEQFVLVYGEKGPRMTWEQRAAAGVPAEKFQAALATKQRGR